jgi:DNA-3-methyladenine glycosylase I
VPVYDDNTLFEFLILEGAQAGLSWETILNKRENFRAALDNFDAQRIASYDEAKIKELLSNQGIIRNKLKITAAIENARAYLKIKQQCEFQSYIWQFVDGQPIKNSWPSLQDVPAKTAQSDAMSSQLKRDGFKFVGSTICYAFMQAVGMVNDHIVPCFRYRELN